jgi:hypothetical protein
MKVKLAITLALVSLAALLPAASAQAAFDVTAFDVAYEDQFGQPTALAGSHPYAMKTRIEFSNKPGSEPGKLLPDGSVKDLTVELPPGLVGDRSAVPYCSTADFLTLTDAQSNCPDNTAVGILEVSNPGESGGDPGPAFNLQPPPGAAAKIGFVVLQVPVALIIRVSPVYPHNLIATLQNTADVEPIGGSTLTIWGNPASPLHDEERGFCANADSEKCPVDLEEKPFLTLPRACTGNLFTTYSATSWEDPLGAPLTGQSATPLTTFDCGSLPFGPTITAKPTTLTAQSPTGLDFSLDVKDEGLQNPEGRANSDVRKAVVTLPEGMTVNPSIAEGLEVCTKEQLARETVNSAPGEGCPNASKIGTVEVETPLLDENVNGAIYQAPQDDPSTTAPGAENPFDTLVALNMVIKNPTLGIIVKQAIEVKPDPVTGRLTTVADNIPQLPFSHFRLKFREGTRSPLASPQGCGTFRAEATLYPWSGNAPVTTDSAFSIITGPGAGPCPAGAPPFKPGLTAGTLNNAAGKYSPFNLRLTRNDGEQEFTHFSIKLPPGLTGKLAGIPFCPDAAIEAAKTRTANAELAQPSCPQASEVGRTLVGAGVGPSLAYAPGKIYLAGPYNGSPMSMAAITAAKVGPFELGTVVVREALRVNPETAEVFVDATGSDPIPHILKGIPVHARDIRVYVDRPGFVLNPTSCARTSTASTVLGSGADFGSEADNVPVTVTSPFQAADCASLGFKPKLALTLKGGTRRSQNPALKAVLTARPGDANIGRAAVTLPHSAFLDQSHIRTVCTRVQFKAGAGNGAECPKGSIYGYAKAITPLLDEPVEGPVILRSSNNELPDLVAVLHSGRIDVNLVGRIDSGDNGGIRNTFDVVPDAPVTKFTLSMQGGKKGLIVNSVNLCRTTNRAKAAFTGQNGKRLVLKPVVKPSCKKSRKGGHK